MGIGHPALGRWDIAFDFFWDGPFESPPFVNHSGFFRRNNKINYSIFFIL